jgi:Heavy metal binding domain
VTSDEPGSCPKCGMTLVPTEAPAQAAHGHDHAHPDPAPQAGGQYSCPMHPEVTSDEPGNCPKCGMTLVPMDPADGSGEQDHSAHASRDQNDAQTSWLAQIEPGFMSMIEMTEGTPRSSDGLQMEWITTPFGPFFPGLPGGLTLDLTLDGDTVAEARAGSLVGVADLLQDGPLPAADYVAGLAAQMRLTPVSYRLLACRAIEAAAGLAPDEEAGQRREAALERERISSHLFWLAQLGRQLGLVRIGREAAVLGLMIRTADQVAIRGRTAAVNRLIASVRSTRFLALRLAEAGQLPADAEWLGPAGDDDTAAGRLAARLTDIAQGLGRIDAAPGIAAPELADIADASGHAHATVETPRGAASLHVEVATGRVVSATLHTPSARHVELVGPITEQRELADALVGVASLDLNPWEIGA